jgi:Fasciclin domain
MICEGRVGDTSCDAMPIDDENNMLGPRLLFRSLTRSNYCLAGPFTLFAPTNNAINDLDPALVAALSTEEGLPELQRILRYHIVPGIVLSDEIADGDMVATLEGSMLTIAEDVGAFFVNGAEVLDSDILTSNGVLHVVRSVLIPPLEVVTNGTDSPATNSSTDAPVTDTPIMSNAPTTTPTSETAGVEVQSPVDPMPDEVEQETTEGTNSTDATDSPEDVQVDPDQPQIEVDAGNGTESQGTESQGVASAALLLSHAISAASMLPFLLFV